MWWVVGYVAILVCAGALFTWLALRERWIAALGALMGLAGAQLAALHTMRPLVGIVMAAVGAALLARDTAAIAFERAASRPAFARVFSRHCDAER